MPEDYIEKEETPHPLDTEKIGINLFKRNHKCGFIKAIEETKLDDTMKNKLKEGMFKVKAKPAGGVGTVHIIECLACSEEFDVTDYEVW